ncbi:TetR/AcrR family transcriptional regulator [Actinoplanes couchii]|uniref:TetR family transcriptional regulator n=1 Tax=Actinoplanes couchii TaxID=403638 RepID=A0ABQ3XTU0_9ACTN|nr:TetR family transcriptional regulator [Actinoplanes couchii]MDR6317769.1 AcrR family transcriptional regulator [Actinoplanes couchii]GID61937.1 TetR family transcriptional regulator [Actinoplanes couchii]
MGDEPVRRAGRGGRERVLAAANRLFAAQGITATTMEDIAAGAPVSKRTLYAHFPAKEDLVLAHLDHIVTGGWSVLTTLARTDLSPRERLLAMFTVQPWPDGTVRGCPFLHAAAEYPDPDSPVHTFARNQKLTMLRLVTELLTEMGAADPGALAEQLVTLADGAASRAMVLDDPGYGRHARAAAETLIDLATAAQPGGDQHDQAGGDRQGTTR